MIVGLTWTLIAIAGLVGAIGVVAGLLKVAPNDLILGGTALVELGLIVQVVVAIVAPLTGNEPTGDLLEFWIYLITAVLMPPFAVIWGLVDRGRWATVILGVVGLAIAVMVYRMNVIWTVQGA